MVLDDLRAADALEARPFGRGAWIGSEDPLSGWLYPDARPGAEPGRDAKIGGRKDEQTSVEQEEEGREG